jgi:hypothetical protein
MTFHRYDPITCGVQRRTPNLGLAVLVSFASGALFSWVGPAVLPGLGDAVVSHVADVSRLADAEPVDSDTWRRARLSVPYGSFVHASGSSRAGR